MISKSPIAKRLKEARLAKGLSQKSLGIAAGIDEFSASPRMNQYERGKHAPDFCMMERLAEVLGLPTAYFYAKEDWLAKGIKTLVEMPKDKRADLLKSQPE